MIHFTREPHPYTVAPVADDGSQADLATSTGIASADAQLTLAWQLQLLAEDIGIADLYAADARLVTMLRAVDEELARQGFRVTGRLMAVGQDVPATARPQ